MRLTLRGWTAVAVVALSLALGWLSGPRALNAVATPLCLALVAGVVMAARTDRPSVDRQPIDDGYVGDDRTVEIAIDATTPVSATVTDTVGDGISTIETEPIETTTAGDPRAETTLGTGTNRIRYDLRLEERGDRTIGPLSIAVRDVLGLVERRFEYADTASVIVYPRPYDLYGDTRDLRTLADAADRYDREEFDHLREYRRGDSLRDVDWKSAAKRPDDDLVVTEYVADEGAGSVTVAAECPPGRADTLATAVASVVTYLQEADVEVGLVVPDETRTVSPGAGRRHHRELLAALAVLESGELEPRDRRDADVLVRDEATETVVVVDERTIPFERLVGSGDAAAWHDRNDSEWSDSDAREVDR
ncbi:DUF58 domain-containing protein [Halopiger djelfimassiliensis]|uniref:DUF58 domain-containing protein n=1 Tax=Halopiger djelfimassiliensis TaxID=1293047 RepID=UPI0006781D76|nr:DUF58 domain-containing protein [Halopiger djelfimassiliensis]